MGEVAGSLEAPPMVIRSSSGKLVLGVLGSAVFIVIGMFMMRVGDDDAGTAVMGGVCALFFGAIGLLSLAKLFRPDRLELTPQHLRYHTLFGTAVDVPWSAVRDIGTWSMRGATLVVFSVDEQFKTSIRFQGPNRAFTGTDVALPGGWPMGGQKLSELLEDARMRWG